MPTASSLAAEVKEQFQLESELVELSGGVFEVYYRNELLFSKKDLGRFPESGEVVEILRNKVAA